MKGRCYAVGLLGAVALALGAGCAGDDPAAVSSRTQDCLRAWNDPANGSNRSAVTEGGVQWRVAVTPFVVNHPADDVTGEGCSYFFSTDARWISFSVGWKKDGGLRWDAPPSQRGSVSPKQHIPEPNANVHEDGTLH